MVSRKRPRRKGEGALFYDQTHRYWVGRIVVAGKRYTVTDRDEKVAEAKLAKLRRPYIAQVAPATGSLDDYLAEWLASKVNLAEGTRVSYAGHINNHISPLLGGIRVNRLTHRDVRRLIADRMAAGLSAATVHRIHSTLHGALQQGVDDRTLADNAADGVDLPKVEEHLVEAMTEDAADEIRKVMRGTFLEALTELLLGSGLRLGEALGLDQGDVSGSVVMVRRSKTTKRAVVISDDAADALARHIKALKVRGANEPVFWGPRAGRRLTGATVSHAFPRLLERAEVKRLTPHGTRHGVATLLVAKGVHMKHVAEQLGHRSVQTTDRFYAHVAPETLRENVGLLNRRRDAR